MASGSYTRSVGPQLQQAVDQHQGRGLAHVVGARLERQPPHGRRQAGQLAARNARTIFSNRTVF